MESLGTLTPRALNRATLARQMLLARASLDPVAAITHLAGLQAQYSPSSFVALWSRLHDFQIDTLHAALTRREVIKATLMRATLHLVSATEFAAYQAAIVRFIQSAWEQRAIGFKVDSATIGLDGAALRRAVIEYCQDTPRTSDEIGNHLATVFPEVQIEPAHFWRHVRWSGELCYVPPSGTWRYFGEGKCASVSAWVPGYVPVDEADGIQRITRRHLAAYGPATAADVASWCGLRVGQVRPALESLAPELVTVQDGPRRTLYDLADAPRPDEDTPAPVRYLAKWDSLLLGYDNRRRILPDEYVKLVTRKNLEVLPTFLVDGLVTGVWDVSRKRREATLQLTAFAAIDQTAQHALEAEGDRLLRFMEPDASTYAIRITPAA